MIGKLNRVLAAIKPGSPKAAIIIASYSECISANFSNTKVPVICASTFVEIYGKPFVAVIGIKFVS